jgi:hypothetical protein
MRSLLAAILSLFLPPRGAHRAVTPPASCPPACRPAAPRPPLDVIAADGMRMVRPYLVVWERERDELDRRRIAREGRRAAVLAMLGQDDVSRESAA